MSPGECGQIKSTDKHSTSRKGVPADTSHMLPDNLEPVELRVIGSLIEKELSTPDNYPLSLNALTSACNQSSNRDPVMSLDEQAVLQAIDSLRRRSLVRSIQGIGSRVPKYQHLLAEAGEYSRAELALLSALALRGPQTQAELRTRAARLMPGDDASGLDAALDALVMREPQPVVVRLARRPGQKETRYAHLLAGDPEGSELLPSKHAPEADRVAAIEEIVKKLRDDVDELRRQVAELRSA